MVVFIKRIFDSKLFIVEVHARDGDIKDEGGIIALQIWFCCRCAKNGHRDGSVLGRKNLLIVSCSEAQDLCMKRLSCRESRNF